MPDNPPTGAPQDNAVDRAQALTPEQIEEVLAEFRAWLQLLPASGTDSQSVLPTQPTVDLHTLVGQLTALRHEVNLQTKAVRNQQEQSGEMLRLLTESVEALERSRETPDEDAQLRPLLKGLVDLYDALALARRELERVRELSVTTAVLFSRSDEPVPELPPEPQKRHPSFWDRLLSRDRDWPPAALAQVSELRDQLTACRSRLLAAREEGRQAKQVLERAHGFVSSVITGYTMSLQRLERLLAEHGLEPLACVGQPFDPERMEVLEAVQGTGRPFGEVVEEVRRGYWWRGRVFRFALVRVAKGE